MTIAIDTSPLTTGHKDRGIGIYTSVLWRALTQFDTKNTYVEFSSPDIPARADIVHYPFFDLFNRTLSRVNKKTVVTVHDLVPLKYPEHFPRGIRGSFSWFLQRRSLLKAGAIITDSDASKKDIQTITHFPEKDIYVVPIALRSEFVGIKNHDIGNLHLPKTYVLYVGDVNWNKNVLGLIKGFAALKKEHGFADMYLVLAGKAFMDETLAETREINLLIHTLKIGPFVRKLGFVPTSVLPLVYKGAVCYTQPSFDEGFGLPVLEALSSGVPVIVSNAPSLREIAGQEGYYVDPSIPGEIKDAIKHIALHSPQARKELILKGVKRSSVFTSQKMAQETTHVYQRVFENK